MFAPRGQVNSVGNEPCTVFCDEGNVRQLVRFPHLIEPVSDLFQLCLVRVFYKEVIGDGDVFDFLNPCSAQEVVVFLQELPYTAWVGEVLLVEEELRGGIPSPFQGWVVNIEE